MTSIGSSPRLQPPSVDSVGLRGLRGAMEVVDVVDVEWSQAVNVVTYCSSINEEQ